MRRPAKLLSLLLLLAALAGCVDDAPDDSTDPHTNPVDTPDEPAETPDTPQEPTPNETTAPVVPVPSITGASTGDAPIDLEFTFDATGTTNDTTWSIFWGDGESIVQSSDALPVTLTHNFSFAGSYELRFAVDYVDENGTEAAAVETLAIELTGAQPKPPAGTWVKDEEFTFEGLLLAGVQGLSCGTGLRELDGVTEAWVPWTFTAEEADGTPTRVSHVAIHLEYLPPGNDLDMDFLAPDGTVLGESHSANALSQAWTEDIVVDGNMAPGDYEIYVTSCLSPASYTLTGTATYVVA